jgi:hypothetical protein
LAILSKANIEYNARSSGDESRGARKALRFKPNTAQRAVYLGRPQISGGNIEEAIPDPISNSVVKLFGADGTARATVWESRTPPG